MTWETLNSLLWTAEEEALLSAGSSGHPQRIGFYFLSLEVLEYMHWEVIVFREKIQAAFCLFWSAIMVCVLLRKAVVILFLHM